MDDSTAVYVLVTLRIDAKGEVQRKNVGVTLSIHDAEAHQAKDIANEYEMFEVGIDWQEAAAMSAVVGQSRIFREMIANQIAEALR